MRKSDNNIGLEGRKRLTKIRFKEENLKLKIRNQIDRQIKMNNYNARPTISKKKILASLKMQNYCNIYKILKNLKQKTKPESPTENITKKSRLGDSRHYFNSLNKNLDIQISKLPLIHKKRGRGKLRKSRRNNSVEIRKPRKFSKGRKIKNYSFSKKKASLDLEGYYKQTQRFSPKFSIPVKVKAFLFDMTEPDIRSINSYSPTEMKKSYQKLLGFSDRILGKLRNPLLGSKMELALIEGRKEKIMREKRFMNMKKFERKVENFFRKPRIQNENYVTDKRGEYQSKKAVIKDAGKRKKIERTKKYSETTKKPQKKKRYNLRSLKKKGKEKENTRLDFTINGWKTEEGENFDETLLNFMG